MPEVKNSTDYGVLKLTLHPGSYDWKFFSIACGSFSDSGSSVHVTPVAAEGLLSDRLRGRFGLGGANLRGSSAC